MQIWETFQTGFGQFSIFLDRIQAAFGQQTTLYTVTVNGA